MHSDIAIIHKKAQRPQPGRLFSVGGGKRTTRCLYRPQDQYGGGGEGKIVENEAHFQPQQASPHRDPLCASRTAVVHTVPCARGTATLWLTPSVKHCDTAAHLGHHHKHSVGHRAAVYEAQSGPHEAHRGPRGGSLSHNVGRSVAVLQVQCGPSVEMPEARSRPHKHRRPASESMHARSTHTMDAISSH